MLFWGLAICIIVLGGTDALASIGLIAFLGVAQIVPPLFGGMIWRGATKAGAISGVTAGFFLWAYTLFLPSFAGNVLLSAEVIENGLFGLWILQPYALFEARLKTRWCMHSSGLLAVIF